MLNKLKNLLKPRSSGDVKRSPADLNRSGMHRSPNPAASKPAAPKPAVPRPTPDYVDPDEGMSGQIDSLGPGKNVLIRNRYVREDTGTHETLKILDDDLVDSGEEAGIDPYNKLVDRNSDDNLSSVDKG